MTRGIVRDIRTGRAVAKTSDLTETFTNFAMALLEEGKEIYVVCGNCRHADTRDCVDRLRGIDIVVVRDRQFPPDRLWLFEGTPEELGFAS